MKTLKIDQDTRARIEAALRRVETGMSTVADAALLRRALSC